MGRGAVFVGLRFLVACLVLGGALHLARPVLYPAVARVARDLAVLTTPRGLVASASWIESREQFQLVSQSLREAVRVKSVSLLLILVLPSAFTFALPAPRRAAATLAVFAGCLLAGSLIVGQDLLAFLNRTMEEQGVSLFSPAVSAFHEGWINLGWDFAMIGVPATVCILALWPLLDAEPAKADAPPRRIGWRGPSAAVLAVAAAFAALDTAASARAGDADAQRGYLLALGEREPGLAEYFLVRGEAALGEGRVRAAAGYFKRAALFPNARPRAAEGMASARALRAAGRRK